MPTRHCFTDCCLIFVEYDGASRRHFGTKEFTVFMIYVDENIRVIDGISSPSL